MKKVSLVVAAALLMSSVTFAQETAATKQEPVKTEKKEEKKMTPGKAGKKSEHKKAGSKKETAEMKKAK